MGNVSNSKVYSRAFTLIEILVALVIVAIVMAVAVLSMDVVGRKEKAKFAADRLVEVITYATQQSLLQLNPISLRVSPRYYAFYEYCHDAWQAMPQAIFAQRHLPYGITAQLHLAGSPSASQAGQVVFSQTGDVVPFVVDLKSGHHVIYKVTVGASGVAHAQAE
ncbi:MAG: type II secretion system protein GspH [Legionellaceae bacterium]|nr:type II secretion system protein GspH [Legionellaceae bacterium]